MAQARQLDRPGKAILWIDRNPTDMTPEHPPISAERPAGIAETIAFDMTPAKGGAPFRIFLHVPGKPAPASGWPVLYMTDGNAVIATAVDAMRVQSSYPTGTNVGDGVIVAIGYPVDGPYDPFRRSWDLCPPPAKAYPPFVAGGPEVLTGGGDELLAFIEDELKPLVESRAAVDRSRQALFGHSFGGLFALHAFFAAPGSFRTIVAASPAVYWDDFLIHRSRDRFLADMPDDIAVDLVLSAGEYEGPDLAPFQVGAADASERLAHKQTIRTLDLARDMAAFLDGLPAASIRASFEVHAGETHMSILPVAVNRAVQAAFAVRR